jgi:single-stranded DNA-binding protein
MFGGSKDKGASFINFIIWQPDVKEVSLVEDVVNNKTVVKVEGYLRQNKWEDREGKKRSVHELGVNNISVSANQPPKQNFNNSQERRSNQQVQTQTQTQAQVPNEDIPF